VYRAQPVEKLSRKSKTLSHLLARLTKIMIYAHKCICDLRNHATAYDKLGFNFLSLFLLLLCFIVICSINHTTLLNLFDICK
jgi:UDP-N-acetylmuramyl pentapeptide phosphotransferase/UDP-N-acetylglucosamine-1-phosphate transferase